MQTITVNAYGKINLTLDIIGKRPDGYHELESLMQQVSLYDVVTMRVGSGDSIVVRGDGKDVPLGEGNIAYKAVRVLRDYLQESFSVDVFIRKKIPVAGGMAGGSTNAAAVLIGLNEIMRLNLDQETLQQLGLKLGADVPFCIAGGTAVARGIGEILTPISPPPEMWMVIIKPDFGVSTALVYKGFRFEEVTARPDLFRMLQGIELGQVKEIYEGMGNVLESVTFKLQPVLKDIKKSLQEWGAEKVIMSGSGPTMLAFVGDQEKAVSLAKKGREFSPADYQIEIARTRDIKEGVIRRNGE